MNTPWLQLKVHCTNRYVKKTYLNFNWKVVGPFNIDDIFQNELILEKERKTVSEVLLSSPITHHYSTEICIINCCASCWGELDFIIEVIPYLLWFLTEEETMVEFGLIEAAADDGDCTVVSSAVIVSPKFKELSLTSHVLSECFKTWPDWNQLISSSNQYSNLSWKNKEILHDYHVTCCIFKVSGCPTWSRSWTTHSPLLCLNDSRLDWCGTPWSKPLLWEAENTGAPSACSSRSSSATGSQNLFHLTEIDK